MVACRSGIGEALDTVPGADKRTVPACAGRLLEEVIELCLAAGLSVGQIQEHVHDSVFNQFLKLSSKVDRTVFPSQTYGMPETHFGTVEEEMADVMIQLCDLHHVAQIEVSMPDLFNAKAQKFMGFIATR